jgi:acyl-CoA synthetase (NDP forming)
VVGLRSREAVRAAAVAMLDRLRTAKLPPEGLIVQAQIDGGVEALVGVTSDPTMGPLVVAGLGGVQVELLRDVAMRLPPVSDLDVEEMLSGLRSAKLLDGFRGAPAADRGALAETIRRVSALVDVLPELAELDLNPVKVLAPGEGAVALDVRMRITP